MELTPVNAIQDLSYTGMLPAYVEHVNLLPYYGPDIPVAYSCMNARDEDKGLLLGRLINTLNRFDKSSTPPKDPSSYTLRNDDLGRPFLYFGTIKGPSVSFSHLPGSTWAAMSRVKRLGIDAALPGEFNEHYPFHKVFSKNEFGHALKLCGGVLADASALLWSAKEAAVKAMGCGFHLFGPLEIKIGEFQHSLEGFTGTVDAGIKVPFRAVRKEPAWVSLAWIS
ncbi:4'-phosphopantetheinyl transferase family protein [Thermodesulfobacteriota bacterium]